MCESFSIFAAVLIVECKAGVSFDDDIERDGDDGAKMSWDTFNEAEDCFAMFLALCPKYFSQDFFHISLLDQIFYHLLFALCAHQNLSHSSFVIMPAVFSDHEG